MFWILLLVTSLLFAYFVIYKPHKYWENRQVKFLKPYPIIGSMLPFFLRKISLFHLHKDLYNQIEGRYYGMYQFTKPILIIKDLDLIKHIAIKDFDHFVDHDSFFSAIDERVFRENVFSSTGDKWRELRALLSPAFTGSKMRSMFILIEECANRFVEHYTELLTKNNNKVVDIELKEVFKRYTIDVIGTCAYGIESNSVKNENEEFYQISKDISDNSGLRNLIFIGYLISPRLMKYFNIKVFSDEQINFFMNLITNNIKYREENNVYRPDLIHLMMEARKGKLKYEESAKNDNTGFATVEESDIGKKTSTIDITDEVIVAQALIFFIGGTDTTSTALGLIGAELAINEDIQRKLQTEIDETLRENNGKANYEIISKLKYLDMVVCETLRKWPQGFFIDRLCVKDYKVPGENSFEIKKGENICIPVVGMHLDPKYYPNPDKFDPERFSDENKKNINLSTYLPFGYGPRNCIGNRFALLKMKTLLFHLLSKFDIVCTKKSQVPIQLSKSQIVVAAENGFWFGFQLRK